MYGLTFLFGFSRTLPNQLSENFHGIGVFLGSYVVEPIGADIAIEASDDKMSYPCIRQVDAYYEEGVFYVTTWAQSNKMLQISNNKNVAFSNCPNGITGRGIGENLGWVLDPKNAELRVKLRKVFSKWYDEANDEKNENCVILAIRITKALILMEESNAFYNLDFVNKVEG